MSPASASHSAPLIDGVPHAASTLAELQRQSECVSTFGCPPAKSDDASETVPTGVAAPVRVRVVRSSLVTVAGYGLGQVIRLAGNILISRLVLPEAFGIMALVNVMIQGLAMFSDVGIEPALVQHRRGDEPRFYNTAWTVQVLRGFLLWLGTCLLAWPASLVYEEPRLLILLPTAGLAAVVAGFNSTALFAVRRHLMLGRLTLLELSAQVAAVATMCLWAAFVSAGAWAMIAGLFATTVVQLVGSRCLVANYRNQFAWDGEAADALFRFGRWVLLSTMITFCALQVDRLLLGRLITKEELGVYSVALAVAMLPSMLLQALGGTVIYPLMARLARRSREELCEKLTVARSVLSALGVFLVVGVVLEAETFFSLLYDARYASAGHIAKLLAVSVWIMSLSVTLERVPQALGETRLLAMYNFIKLTAAACGALSGYHLAGFDGFLLGYAAGIAVGHVALAWMLREFGVSVWRDDLRFTAIVSLATWFGVTLVQSCDSLGGTPTADACLREVVAWGYLLALGFWALRKSRALASLGDA
ncbi:MAG: hypothetical protein C0483_08185 [Pirellula sp.]|nr:hypothetical protein [Pirellula sp.]